MTQLTSFKTTTNSSNDIDLSDSDKMSETIDLEALHTDIQTLRAQIDSTAPCGELLVRIHKDLYAKPECFAVLSNEEIAAVIGGIKKHTQRELMVGKEKTRLKKNFSMDDLDL